MNADPCEAALAVCWMIEMRTLLSYLAVEVMKNVRWTVRLPPLLRSVTYVVLLEILPVAGVGLLGSLVIVPTPRDSVTVVIEDHVGPVSRLPPGS